MDEELIKLENELKKFTPCSVSGDVLSRMVEAMDRWQDYSIDEDKVVTFPAAQSPAQSSRNWHPTWAAAAAVAIIGGLVGLVIPANEDAGVMANAGLGQVPAYRQASFAPVNTSSNVTAVSSTMMSDRRGVPYQVVRVVRQEEANFKGSGHVGLKISKPQVETYVVPVAY